MVCKDIKKEIATILFDGARKYKDRIKLNCDSENEQIIEKKRKFYFGVQYADLLDKYTAI